jgi:hypothetical protein
MYGGTKRIPLLVMLAVGLVGLSCGGGDDKTTNPPANQPDLTVQSVTVAPTNPVAGQPLTAHVVVRNAGDADAVATKTRVRANGSVSCAEIATNALAAGASTTVDCTMTPGAAGSLAIEACADVTSLATESNESNNCTTQTVTVTGQTVPQPDLIVEQISFSPASPVPGQAVTVTVEVKNNGAAAAAASQTRVSVDGTPTCAQIATGTIAVGATVSVTCDIGSHTTGSHTVQACADVQAVVAESNESNNCNEASLTVGSGPSIPGIPTLSLPTAVDFGSTDTYAMMAQSLVNGQLLSAAALAGMGGAWLLPLAQANWVQDANGCWGWDYSYLSCSWKYAVCNSQGNLEWTLTVDGTCGGNPVSNWVALRGTTTADGLSGTFRVYEEGTTTVSGAWDWVVAADQKSGTWTFYNGDIDEANISEIINWVSNTDGSDDVTMTSPASNKTETHVAADENSGWSKMYDWHSATTDWVMTTEIDWIRPHGTWTDYNPDGTVADEHTW